MNLLSETDVDDIQLTPADETAILLTALQDVCTEEEYNDLVMEGATELALYGLIESPEIVTEAKKIVYKQTKQMNLNREQTKAALRMAKKANSPEWKRYHKHRTLMIEAREDIIRKYNSRAKTEAKKVLKNAKRKASANTSKKGKAVESKIDLKLQEYMDVE